MKLKVMQYNILHGFHGTLAPFQLERERLEAAKEVVREENPDILVLTEAAYGSPNNFGISMNYAEIFGYPYSYFAPWGNYEWGNCLLSKFPINGETITLSSRTALRARVGLGKKALTVDVFHPKVNITEDEKIDAIKPLLQNIPECYLLTGDFNAISDEDEYNHDRMLAGFRRFDKTPEVTVAEIFRRKLIPYVKSQGLKDAFSPETRHYTIPTDMCSRIKDSAMRIDYFFVPPKMKVLETRVVINDLTERASDHYPIIAVLDV